MTPITTTHYAVEVPKSAHSVIIDEELFYKIGDMGYKSFMRTLPPGQWRYCFTTEGVTQEQAATIVDTDGWKDDGYIDYGYMWSAGRVLTAIESLTSLLTSKGLTGENYVIISKQ